MEEGAVAPALRSAAERAIALAASGRWSAAVDALRMVGPAEAGACTKTLEIGDDDAAHATVFTLEHGAVIPLHDHPEMTVVSKVLHGRMRVETFEWIDRPAGLARDCGAREISEHDEPLLFGPAPGMLHRITALSDCTFVDVFAPYYTDERPCRYYRVVGSRLEPTGEIAP